MQINYQKSGVLLHNRKKIQQKIRNNMEIMQIPVVQSYKYLGILIDAGLTFSNHLEAIKDKTKKALHMIKIMKLQKVDSWKIL